MALSDVEKVVRKITGIKPAEGEDRQDYLKRLAKHLNKEDSISEDVWTSLEKIDGAQKWINDACTAFGEDENIEDFPGVEDEADDEDSEEESAGEEESSDDEDEDDEKDDAADDDDESESAPAKEKKVSAKKQAAPKKKAAAPKKAKADKPKAAKPEKKAAAKTNGSGKSPKVAKEKKVAKPKKDKKQGKGYLLKRMILDKPDATVAELMAKMEKAGCAMSHPTLVTIRSGFLHSKQVIEDAGRLKAKGE